MVSCIVDFDELSNVQIYVYDGEKFTHFVFCAFWVSRNPFLCSDALLVAYGPDIFQNQIQCHFDEVKDVTLLASSS